MAGMFRGNAMVVRRAGRGRSLQAVHGSGVTCPIKAASSMHALICLPMGFGTAKVAGNDNDTGAWLGRPFRVVMEVA